MVKNLLITGFDFEKKQGVKRQRLYFTDLKKLYGPVLVKWNDYYISKPLSEEETKTLLSRLEELPAVMKEARQYSSHKRVVHIRGNFEGALEKNFRNYFEKQSPTEITRLRMPFPDTAITVDTFLEEALERQKTANQLFREIHDNYCFGLIMQEFSEAEIRERLRYAVEVVRQGKIVSGKKTKKAEKISQIPARIFESMKKIAGEQEIIDSLVQKYDPANFSDIDLDNRCLRINLDSQNCFRFSKESLLSPEKLSELIRNSKVGVGDLELGEYKTDNPFIYLYSLLWQQEGVQDGIIFGTNKLEETVETDDGPRPYILCSNQDELRKAVARFRFDKDFIIFANHNLLGFDDQKSLNPRRTKKAKLKGDGIFRISPDNSEPEWISDTRGKEKINARGVIYIDTNKIGENYFSHIFSGVSLESMAAWFNRFFGGCDFEKSLPSPDRIEEMRELWEKGDGEAGKKVAKYCYTDCKPVFFLLSKLLAPVYFLAKASGTDLFTAGVSSPKNLAKIFLEREHYRSTGTIKFWDNFEMSETAIRNLSASAWSKKAVSEHAQEHAVLDKENAGTVIIDTNIFEKLEIRKNKKRILGRFIEETKEDGFYSDVNIYFAPILAQGAEKILRRNESLNLLFEQAGQANPLVKIMYYEFLEAIAANCLIDTGKTISGDLPELVYFARYMQDAKKTVNDFNKSLEGIVKSAVACTGDLILTPETSERLLDLGRANAIKIGDSVIFELKGLVKGIGIEIPNEKKRHYSDPEEGEKTYAEIKIVYDFVKAALQNPEAGLRNLAESAKKLPCLDKRDYLFTYRNTKEELIDYSAQGSERVRLLKKFKIGIDETGIFAVGSWKDTKESFLRYLPTEREIFEKEFTPLVSHYQKRIFGNGKTAYRIANALYRVEEAPEAWKRLVLGEASEEDIRALLK